MKEQTDSLTETDRQRDRQKLDYQTCACRWLLAMSHCSLLCLSTISVHCCICSTTIDLTNGSFTTSLLLKQVWFSVKRVLLLLKQVSMLPKKKMLLVFSIRVNIYIYLLSFQLGQFVNSQALVLLYSASFLKQVFCTTSPFHEYFRSRFPLETEHIYICLLYTSDAADE